ncbi:hypothetical protein M3226_17760 [Neobacillus cucumis]|uniref:hypothetical protein n=1 Tax=Neobacillus cucumis TaxID=1740721 RepID=UPI00203FC0D9|nr:hypothetical protein [Neobacillus cucumis]MCM3727525.1 hypothetical protein [Neobacillus cucumis]
MFNEFEVYQLIKLLQEEVERIAQNENAWKLERLKKESFIQIVAKKLKLKPKLTIVKTNGNGVCC